MATDSVENSSDEEISFSEWQFVVKNISECSDDESIEIIEREILHSVTPSSCSEDEVDADDEPEIVDWEVPTEDASIHPNDEESAVNPPSEDEACEIDTDPTTKPWSYVPEEIYVAPTSINFSRKVLYSCVLAAVISVIIHQYRGNLLDVLLNRVYAKSKGIDPFSPEVALCLQPELKQQPEGYTIHPDDVIVKNLIEKREKFKNLCQKYEMILSNTFILKSNLYAIEVSVLQEILSSNIPSIRDEPCETDNEYKFTICTATDSSGKAFYHLSKEYYHLLMKMILGSMQFDEAGMHESLNDLLRMQYQSRYFKRNSFKRLYEKLNYEKSNTEIIRENIQADELLADDSTLKDDTILINVNEADSSKIGEKPDAELNVQEVIEEVRILYRKISEQVENFQSLSKTCDNNKRDSCVLKIESSEQNDTFANEAEKINITHNEENKSVSVSEFIYKTAPTSDRWSLKMNSKPSTGTNHEESNIEWFLKMGKAREKYRRRYKDKHCKKKAHKSNYKNAHELYKRYREFITRTREKIKVDYKKYASQFKSKLKKFGDGMKRSYEKLISSDWKHYARSVFESFRF